MALPVVTFPQPPPTSNNLTSNQRQQLLRSTRKLTKLLGSAPHLTDHDDPPPALYLDLSSKLQSISRAPSPSRGSHEIPRPPSPASSISSVSTTTTFKIHHKTHFPSQPESQIPKDTLDSPFARKRRPPTLRLASTDDEFSQSVWTRTKLDAVPGSPLVVGDSHPSHSSPVSDASDADQLLTPISRSASPITQSLPRSYTLPVPRRGSILLPSIETSEPTFKVTSEAATRRLKMERIRRRLGECVPVDAVFPDDQDQDGDYVEAVTEKPAQVNVHVRPRWKSSPSTVVTFDVIYECPHEHGDEGLASGLISPSATPKSSVPMGLGNLNTAFPRQWGKLVKRTRRDPRF